MRLCLSCLVRRSNTKLLVILLVICIVSIVVLLAYWLMLVSSMRSTDRRYIFEDSYHADDGAGKKYHMTWGGVIRTSGKKTQNLK